MKFVHGLAFPDWDEYMVAVVEEDGTFHRRHLEVALSYVTRWGVAIDGGAHIGTWTRLMVGRFKRVIAFEPATDTFECLVHNLRDSSNADLRNAALGKKAGFVRMTLQGHEKALAVRNTGARFTRDGGEIIRTTIDSLELAELDFLKLDVEGGEVDALLGAQQTLTRCKPIVLFEDKWLWKRYGYDRHAPQVFLKELGYVHIDRAGSDEIWG